MSFYESELKALQRSGRYRKREVVEYGSCDFASNDYLGLAHRKEFHTQSCQELSALELNSAKASQLVNGYHQIHKDFEDELCRVNGFEAGVILGSGFNANIALIEALVRKGDKLFMDELYHASGVLASNLNNIDVTFFKHNDTKELEELLKNSGAKRNIVAVEGIYSMDGDLCAKEVFTLCERYNAILIVDEAHSSGVIGENLTGVYDHYNIEIKPNHIKMGTLGKAYGSFGAYILSSSHINDYLINRAKPIIYATALSLYDTLLGHKALSYILEHKKSLKEAIKSRKELVRSKLGVEIEGLILPIEVGDNKKVLEIKNTLTQKGYSIGAIRQPTVESAILRVILRLGESIEDLEALLELIKSELNLADK
ncbi:MAG: aminotransferase class I/II-fold pyridoxal phosphate-dependent enzyme [Sulfurimonas sp.]